MNTPAGFRATGYTRMSANMQFGNGGRARERSTAQIHGILPIVSLELTLKYGRFSLRTRLHGRHRG